MSVIWHDLEGGAYVADLALWEKLAEAGGGPVLDLGCGTGRVALHLARRGHRVVGVDLDEDLVEAFNRRAEGLPAEAVAADARDFDLGEEFGLILAPTQLAQLFNCSKERRGCLSSVARHLRPDGVAAFAIVEQVPAATQDIPPPLPDAREIEGWVYSSLPLEVVIDDERLFVRRLRQLVSPDGDLTETVDEIPLFALSATRLEDDAKEAGLRPVARDEIAMTDDHVGSIVVLFAEGVVMELRVLALYPDQMNIYADRGNILFLRKRCEWRGIEFAYATAGPGEAIDPGAHDLLYLGGGQDRDQRAVAADMVETKRESLVEAVDDGAVMLAVCGGYQLLGHSYQLGEERLPGIGLADLTTVREPGPRLIGNVAIEADLGEGPRTIAGFENHGGRTYLGEGATPLGRVIKGFGNNGDDGLEGVRRDNLIGTYLHGPLLPKNAWLADHLIALALERRYGNRPELDPLEDDLEHAAEESARSAAMRN